MKILLFGGGFDPPHKGHAALLTAAMRDLRPDRTFVVPSWRSPTKEDHGASAADRLALVRAFAAEVGAKIHLWEYRQRRSVYTYELLRDARTRWPRAKVFFLIDSDSLGTLPKWKRAKELSRFKGWIAGRRPGTPAQVPAGFAARLLKGVFPDESSSMIRAKLYAGEKWKNSLPKAVAKLITRRRLYGLAAHDELSKTLSPNRYEHTLGVAQLAAELASRHGFDPAKAALAGLLHDAGRRYDLSGMAKYASRRRLPVPNREVTLKFSPLLAHAYISADLAERRFGVKDRELLDAVALHTLGEPGMSAFSRLLYVADIASGERDFPAAAKIRTLARKDLDRAFVEAVRTKDRHVRKTGLWLHPMTTKVLRFAEGL